MSLAGAAQATPRIVANQLGYYPDWPKHVVVVSDVPRPEAAVAELIDVATDAVVQTIDVPAGKLDRYTQHIAAAISLPAVPPGTYRLRLGKVNSRPIVVGREVNENPLRVMLRGFYLQRCGVPLRTALAGLSHPICHAKDGVLAHHDGLREAGAVHLAAGGWHDAGDYGKYVATTSVAAGQLLSTWERYGAKLAWDDIGIPESGNGIPDILDEAAVGLRWMLRMQRSDGAVYRKLSGKKWPHKTAPEDDLQPRLVYGISTPETAKFAGVMAMAARIYGRWDAKLAAEALAASLAAWSYLERNLGQTFDYREGDDSGSGPYRVSETDPEPALTVDSDDRLWAAAELYVTTRESKFRAAFEGLGRYAPFTMFEWKDPSSLGFVSVLSANELPTALRSEIKARIIARANVALATSTANVYRVANGRFVWGSNKMAAQEGLNLVYAYELTCDRLYLAAATAQVAYLFGANAFDKVFVTGLGERPVENIHHIFAQARGVDIPGLLVGGPNEFAQAGQAAKWQRALSYADHPRSYATNESAVDYNATLVSLLGALRAIHVRTPQLSNSCQQVN